MRIGGQPLQSQTVTNSSMQQVANQGVKTDDNIVSNKTGSLQQADLEGALQKSVDTQDKIYIQTEDGSDSFLEIDLSNPENKQIIESLLQDIQNGKPVQLDATMLKIIEAPNTFVDPNPEISLKDGKDTLQELETMGINIKDGISQDEGQLLIEKLRSEGASAKELRTIEEQIDKKLDRKENLSLRFDKSSGTYSFDFAEQTGKDRDFSWSKKKAILHHGPAKTQGWNLPTLKGLGQIVALPFVETGRAIGKLLGIRKVKCPSFNKRIDTWNLNPKVRLPQWSSVTKYDHTKGATGPKEMEKTEKFSFNIEKTPIPEPYKFDFPNLYQINKTAIEDPEKFKTATKDDNDIFAQIVKEDKNLNIQIKADGSRNSDIEGGYRKGYYSDAEMQDQRAIKGSYSNQDNTFVVSGSADAAPGSGTYRDIDVPPFAREIVEPGVDAVHNDTLSLFRAINAYIEFVNNADSETQAAVKDKKVTFDLHPQVREHLEKVAPDLLVKLDAGLTWNEMNTLPSVETPETTSPSVTTNTSSGSKVIDAYEKKYNENGQLEADGRFKDGQLMDGKKYIYDDDNLLLRIDVYREGKVVGEGTL